MRIDLVENSQPKIKFPCLMINRVSEVIVLVRCKHGSKLNGTVIATLKTDTVLKVGNSGLFYSDNFHLYDGKVTLSND